MTTPTAQELDAEALNGANGDCCDARIDLAQRLADALADNTRLEMEISGIAALRARIEAAEAQRAVEAEREAWWVEYHGIASRKRRRARSKHRHAILSAIGQLSLSLDTKGKP